MGFIEELRKQKEEQERKKNEERDLFLKPMMEREERERKRKERIGLLAKKANEFLDMSNFPGLINQLKAVIKDMTVTRETIDSSYGRSIREELLRGEVAAVITVGWDNYSKSQKLPSDGKYSERYQENYGGKRFCVVCSSEGIVDVRGNNVTSLLPNQWMNNLAEQERALEIAYKSPVVFDSGYIRNVRSYFEIHGDRPGR